MIFCFRVTLPPGLIYTVEESLRQLVCRDFVRSSVDESERRTGRYGEAYSTPKAKKLRVIAIVLWPLEMNRNAPKSCISGFAVCAFDDEDILETVGSGVFVVRVPESQLSWTNASLLLASDNDEFSKRFLLVKLSTPLRPTTTRRGSRSLRSWNVHLFVRPDGRAPKEVVLLPHFKIPLWRCSMACLTTPIYR